MTSRAFFRRAYILASTSLLMVIILNCLLLIKSYAQNLTTDQDMRCYNIILKLEAQNAEELIRGKGYVDYYEILRKQIEEKLCSNTRTYYKEGDVTIAFILKSDGALIKYNVDCPSKIEKKLADVVVLSLKQASPFPPFPKSLPYSQLSFKVTISFRK